MSIEEVKKDLIRISTVLEAIELGGSETIELSLNELDKKDEIINKMANEIYVTATKEDGTHFKTAQEVIDYFIEKVDGKSES